METISRKQFISLLIKTSGKSIKLHTRTPVSMYTTDNPLRRAKVVCDESGEYLFNITYADLVSDAIRKSLGNKITSKRVTIKYNPDTLPWGEWLSQEAFNKIIVSWGKYYLRYYNLIKKENSVILINGKPATPNQARIVSIYTKSKKSLPNSQREAGVINEYKILPRSVNIQNIVSATVDGTDYQLTD